MPNIRVVGDSQTYEYDLIKSSIIQLGGLYYFKHDDKNLVKVKVDGGGYRLYRINSPLICKTISGEFEKKSNCIQIGENEYLLKNSPDTIRLDDGTFTHAKWTIYIHNKHYLKTDPRLVKCHNEGTIVLKDECILLSPEHYGENKYALNNPSVQEINGLWFQVTDLRKVTHWDSTENCQKFTHIPKWVASQTLVTNVFAGFKDASNPQLGRFETCYANSSEVAAIQEGIYVLKGQHEWLLTILTELRNAEVEKVTEAARKKCNAKFSDLDDVENKALVIDPKFQTWGGKQHLFGNIGNAIFSKKLSKTGGIGYTFGVEFETSAGVLKHHTAEELGIEAVGDRSIGAAEYVTMPLQGNSGLEHLELIANALAASTLVDDRCAIHVHVGSPEQESASKWQLNFDRRFAIASIKLGTLIEEELYRALPKSRNPYNRHCHSIQRYSNISENNWKEMLGTFVFGPEENWSRTLDTRPYKYGDESYNKKSGLSTWCGGRYKWLNLVRCYSKCNSPTIEFRIWSPSTNFDKIYNFVLLSLAFTYVADNCYRDVMAGNVDLTKMVNLAYHDYPELVERLLKFIAERTAKFNRKEIYTGITPDKLVTITSEQIETLKTTSCYTSVV